MEKICDEVLGREEVIHRKIGPKTGKEIKLNEITPNIKIGDALEEIRKKQQKGENENA